MHVSDFYQVYIKINAAIVVLQRMIPRHHVSLCYWPYGKG